MQDARSGEIYREAHQPLQRERTKELEAITKYVCKGGYKENAYCHIGGKKEGMAIE